MKNKLESIEAKISEEYNIKRYNEEKEVINEIKKDPNTFYNYAKKHARTNEKVGPIMDNKGNIHTNSKNIADLFKA